MTQINVFANWYQDSNSDRQKEIDFCFQKNLNNPYINFNIIESQNRLSFNHFFERINLISSFNDINCIINSDIFFDNSILLFHKIKEKEFWALSRWDVQEDGSSKLYARKDSQDCWIWRSKINIKCNHFLGVPGIDNHIAYIFNKSGYKVTNPSKSIKTHHLHLTNIRNYTIKDTIPPPYLMIEPITLEEIK